MEKGELLKAIDRLLTSSPTAVLATVDADNFPHIRWMSPVRLPGRDDSLFAISSAHLAKTAQLTGNPHVEWMFQDQTLREIVVVRGCANIIDNPALKREVLEALGTQLTAFWRLAEDGTQMVVLETVIEEAVHYLPMQGLRQYIDFGVGAI